MENTGLAANHPKGSSPPPLSRASQRAQYLGPATVREVKGTKVYLEMPDLYTWAELATGFFYQPEVDDVVLTIGSDQEWYVIGILSSKGPSKVVVPHSLEIDAPAGDIVLRSNREVSVRSRSLRVVANELELVADWLWERCRHLLQKVTGNLRQDAERLEQHIAQDATLDAKTVKQSAEGDLKLKGKSINLN